jgi:hypothetical protein
VGKRRISRKDFHWFAGQHDLKSSNLQVDKARNEHLVVDYTTAEEYGCTFL